MVDRRTKEALREINGKALRGMKDLPQSFLIAPSGVEASKKVLQTQPLDSSGKISEHILVGSKKSREKILSPGIR
jgi:hypothetical protein